MFGSYPIPFEIEKGENHVGINGGDPLRYYRTGSGIGISKHLSSTPDQIIIQPVEPVNLPDPDVAHHLELRFPLQVIGPGEEVKIDLTFPVEIGVIARFPADCVRLDLFSLVHPKFSLYGEPDSGIITRWHDSVLAPDMNAIDPLKEGILRLTVKNSGRKHVEVSRVVFDQNDISLYYNVYASMTATMEIFSSMIAETRVIDQPIGEDFIRFIPDNLLNRSLIIEKKGFMMEHGVAE